MSKARIVLQGRISAKALKPRNPLVALARQRRAGAHVKPEKVQRRQAQQALMSRDVVAEWRLDVEATPEVPEA